MKAPRLSAPVGAAALFVLLALPPVANALQARMQWQMLVQIPLLAACGYLLRNLVSPRWRTRVAAWNPVGINGVLLATLVLAFWMLPRSMDATVGNGWWTAAKYVTLPLLVGLPLGLSWPRANFIVRGVVSMELVAMLWRLGWLYLDSPMQLCNNYLVDDQQLTGQYLLWAGGALFFWLVLQLFAGHIRVAPAETDAASQGEMSART